MSAPALPFPAEAFLADSAVREALAEKKPERVAFLILFASLSWLEADGGLPANQVRIARMLNLSRDVVRDAIPFWQSAGKLRRSGDRLFLPWVRHLKGGKTKHIEAVAQSAAVAALHDDGWPRNFTTWACDVWVARWGRGSAPGDVIASQFRVLRKSGAPWPAVQRSWVRWVQTKKDDDFASPTMWRKRWSSYDPETPEFDHEAAEIADSYDRERRQRDRKMAPIGDALKSLPKETR